MTDHGTATCAEVPRAEAIARLNDQVRFGNDGTVMVTQGVQSITGFDATELAELLANYDDFTHENDPHGERDFGLISYKGWDVIWKIDPYDKELKFGSDNPADPAVTTRIATLLLASEW